MNSDFDAQWHELAEEVMQWHEGVAPPASEGKTAGD